MCKIVKTLLNQILIFLLAGLFSCSSDSEQGTVNAVDPIDPPENFPNILLIIADDMSRDGTFGFDQRILNLKHESMDYLVAIIN